MATTVTETTDKSLSGAPGACSPEVRPPRQ
ncbi:hypothetical protein FHR37_000561 [Actinopolymorpha cephalotaxi]|uniref:Uncharacterized protein n=1 Tax=Actinopolymorpha cephalotaxi TaxID=504797 RepID=A0ABX2RWG4_9ACTN|nr:hypothetical protein [Actinopolymorpha cephalotaxi]